MDGPGPGFYSRERLLARGRFGFTPAAGKSPEDSWNAIVAAAGAAAHRIEGGCSKVLLEEFLLRPRREGLR